MKLSFGQVLQSVKSYNVQNQQTYLKGQYYSQKYLEIYH